MIPKEAQVLRALKNKLKLTDSVLPRYFSNYNWRPKFAFRDRKDHVIVMDFVYNPTAYPRGIYDKEFKKILKDHNRLEISLLIFGDENIAEILAFAARRKITLCIYKDGIINKIELNRFDKCSKKRVVHVKTNKIEWLPNFLLGDLKGLSRLSYRKELRDLIVSLEKVSDKKKQQEIIGRSLDKLFSTNNKYLGGKLKFMQLSQFEQLLKLSDENNRDHFFHSVRVFLVGCVIVDRFYDFYQNTYEKILGSKKINIEYIWLLSSIFHDIGRIHEKAYLLYVQPGHPDDEVREGLSVSWERRWQDEEYKNSLGNVVELIKRSLEENPKGPFIGNAMGVQTADFALCDTLRGYHAKLKSHAAISGFELSADLLRKIRESSYSYKAFSLYHIFPAILAIIFHDWHMWSDLGKYKIFPLSATKFPFSALLIYIDTWDDFKRESADKIEVTGMTVDEKKKSVKVDIEWKSQVDYLAEQIKYLSYKKNVIFDKQLSLLISVKNESGSC